MPIFTLFLVVFMYLAIHSLTIRTSLLVVLLYLVSRCLPIFALLLVVLLYLSTGLPDSTWHICTHYPYLTAPNMAARVSKVVMDIAIRPGID